MFFGLSEDQTLLQESVKRFLHDTVSTDGIRDFTTGEDRQLQNKIETGLQELGVHLTLIPEAHGGLGMGLLEAALVQQMLGHHAAPAAWTAPYVMAPIALRAAGSRAQQAEWFAKIAAGEARFGVGVTETIGIRENAGVKAAKDTISGRAAFVVDTEQATHFLIGCDAGFALVACDGAGITQTPLTTIDKTRTVAMLDFENTPAEFLTENTQSAPARVIEAGRIMFAADSLGVCDSMLEKAVAYAGERKQFGRIIASFQSVKHLCAEMAAQIEPCRSLLWYAAYAFSHVPDESALMSRLVKSRLADVGQYVARTATEVHGGMGFTDLLGLHYWFKRAGANRLLLGGPETVREEAATLQNWA